MTIAEQIAERFNNDGQCFKLGDKRITDIAYDHSVKREANPARHLTRYEFKDGSAIVIAEAAWGIEGDEKFIQQKEKRIT